MSAFGHILVATDFSEHARWARVAAKGLAQSHDAKVSFVHVVRPRRFIGGRDEPEDTGLEHELRRAATEQLQEEAAAFSDEAVTHTAYKANAADGICTVAADIDADLIVLGTRGQEGFDRLLMGSVAEQVVRHAPCSVLTIGREAFGEAWHRSGIVVASDLSPASESALGVAAQLSRLYSTPLTLAHVYDPDLPYPEPGSIREAFGSPDDVRAALQERVDGALKKRLGDLAARADVLPHARPADAICDFLEERKSELLVIATHGRTGLKRIGLGSVAERVVRHAPCPVLTVRRLDA